MMTRPNKGYQVTDRILFDQTNQMKQYPMEMGAAMKQTMEANAYSVLTTAANYTRTTAAGDEQSCLPFSES